MYMAGYKQLVPIKVSDTPRVSGSNFSKFWVLGFDSADNKSVHATMEQMRGNTGDSAFELWQKQPGNAGKTYEDYLAFNKQPATDAAIQVTDKMAQIEQKANGVISSTNAAKSEALAAAARASTAAARASSTATTAEAEIEKMKQLQESILGAASLAPTRMELTYTKRITQRNPYVQRIVAKMFPSYSLQNVLFLGDDVAVSVDPAGVVTPLKIGTSRIHVIPTQATHLYKTINVTVQAPSVRLTGGGKIRIDSKGRIRLT